MPEVDVEFGAVVSLDPLAPVDEVFVDAGLDVAAVVPGWTAPLDVEFDVVLDVPAPVGLTLVVVVPELFEPVGEGSIVVAPSPPSFAASHALIVNTPRKGSTERRQLGVRMMAIDYHALRARFRWQRSQSFQTWWHTESLYLHQTMLQRARCRSAT